MEANHLLKGRDKGHVTHLKFCSPHNDLSGLSVAIVVNFCTHAYYVSA